MIDDMFTEEEKQAALDQAYRFLAQRFLSSYELRQKMKRKQISPELIDYVEERLMYYDYINDERLAKQVVSYLMREQKYGIFLIKQKMKQRGLSIPCDIENYNEMAVAFRIVDKKYGESIDDIPRIKIMNFLKNRGFSMSTITKVCEAYQS